MKKIAMPPEIEIAIDEIVVGNTTSIGHGLIADAIGLEVGRRLQDRTSESIPKSIAVEVSNALRGRMR